MLELKFKYLSEENSIEFNLRKPPYITRKQASEGITSKDCA